MSSRLTLSAAWQEVARYSSQRHSRVKARNRLVANIAVRNAYMRSLQKVNRIPQTQLASACLPKAGAFLNNLGTLSGGEGILFHRSPPHPLTESVYLSLQGGMG